MNPLVADEDNVVRQRSAVHRNRRHQQQSRRSIVERFAALTRRRVKSQSLLKLDARRRRASADARLASPGSDARWREEVMPVGTSGEVMRRKITGGRKAGFARSQCPEEHPGTHCCLRQEARPTSSGSEARWREEVMLEKSSQEVMPLSAALCDQQKLRSTPALSLHPGAQAPASLPPVIFRRITSPDFPPGITS